ncbi:CGNR zinc finger domain-containing protein [Streptomyces hydrogenans]|uniref:CGNR zinc finger domain-containing protein n=1 Tax=Streptomyces hydrogenans TaxID=1873719 RepID=UPI0036737997
MTGSSHRTACRVQLTPFRGRGRAGARPATVSRSDPRAHEIAGTSGLFLDTSRETKRRWCSKNTRGNKVKKARLARAGPVAALRSCRPVPCRPGAPARSVGRPAEGRAPSREVLGPAAEPASDSPASPALRQHH